VISLGGHNILRGDNRKHFRFQNQDARYGMWLYKDKVWDGVRLNNGDDGGGDWLFHQRLFTLSVPLIRPMVISTEQSGVAFERLGG